MSDPSENERLSVLIIGAGPTGLMAGCCLSRLKIPFRIIDKFLEPSAHSKALGVQPRTMEVMKDIDLEKPFLQGGFPVDGLKFFSGKKEVAEFRIKEHLDTPYNFITIFPQSETEKVLIQDLDKRGVKVERGVELKGFEEVDNYYRAHLSNDEVIETQWLLGADGAHSTVRHILGVEFPGTSIEHIFALADVEVAKLPHGHFLSMHFHKDGPILFFPMSENTLRIAVSLKTNKMQEIQQENFVRWLQSRARTDLQIQKVLWTSSFKISHRIAPIIQDGGCFLMGDAFHIHSPIGGQGMNTGIQDAYNLCWKLALVIRGKAPRSILNSYTEERLPNAQQLIKITNRMTKFIDTNSPFIRFFRRFFMRTIFKNSQTAHLLANRMGQLSIHYGHSSLLPVEKPHLSSKCPRPGSRLQEHVIASYDSNKKTSLFELTKGFLFDLLILFSSYPSEQDLQEIEWTSEFIDQHLRGEIRIHNILTDEEIHPKILKKRIRWVDQEKALHKKWGISKPTLILIRPDNYIAYVSQSVNHIEFENYLRKIFIFPE